MEFYSQICTTKEQSKRLITLGLKKETADMAYEYKPKHLADIDTDKDWVIVAHSPCGTDIPAWSLHRLIEMCGEPDDYNRWIGLNITKDYNWFIELIEMNINNGIFSKEYLDK